MPSDLVTIGQFGDAVEAQLALNQLKAAGIPAMLSGETLGGLFTGMDNLFGSIQLKVDEAHAEQALKILDGKDQDLPDDPEPGDAAPGDAITRRDTIRKGEPPRLPPAPDAGERVTTERAPPAPRPYRDDDEDDDLERAIRSGPDEMANRAWKAAVIGLLFMPIQLYTIYLLVRLLFIDEELSAKALWKVFGATLVVCVGLGLCTFMWFSPLFMR